jgi:hypothetical protein
LLKANGWREKLKMEIDPTTISNVMRAIADRRTQTMTIQRRSKIAQLGGKAAWANIDYVQRREITRASAT